MSNKRDLIQDEFCDLILKERDLILFCSVRLGKTRIALKAVEPMDRVLVVYPDTPIKKSWLDELTKFEPASRDITFVTKASLHKYMNTHWDYLIVDEPQLIQSDKQIASLKTITYRKRVGLGGTFNNKTLKKLKDELNWHVKGVYTIADAIKDKLVKDYQINIHFIDLDDIVKIPFDFFKRKSTGTEKQIYKFYSDQMDYFKSRELDPDITPRDRMFAMLGYKKYMGLRTNLLYNSVALLKKAKQLVNERSNDKLLIYTLRTDIADELSDVSYHSKNKEEEVLEMFKIAAKGHMAVVNSVRAGVTILGLNSVLFHSYESNTELLYQKLGRSLLYEFEGEKSQVDLCCLKNTQMEVWVDQACRSLEQDKINYIIDGKTYNKIEWIKLSHPDKELYFYDGAVVYKGPDVPGMFGGTITHYYYIDNPYKGYTLSPKKLIPL